MPLLNSVINLLKQQGVFEIYLPFLLTFSIFYALLRKSKVFGDQDKVGKNISIVISLVAALYITIFSPAAITISMFFATFFAQSSIVFVILLIVLMMATMLWGLDFIDFGKKMDLSKSAGLVIGLLVLLALIMFVTSGGINLFAQIAPNGFFGLSPDDLALLLLVLGTGIIIFWATSSGETNPPRDRNPQGGGTPPAPAAPTQ